MQEYSNELVIREYQHNNCLQPLNIPLFPQTTSFITPISLFSIDKAENGLILTYQTKQYVFETKEKLFTFIDKELKKEEK